MRPRVLLAAIAAAAVAATAAQAANTVVKRHTETVTLAARTTAEYFVAYPDALEYGGATYSGSTKILPPAMGARGRAPSLAKVRILSTGEALGGSELAVRVNNANPAGTAAVRLRITAITHEP